MSFFFCYTGSCNTSNVYCYQKLVFILTVLKNDGPPDEGVLESQPRGQADSLAREKDTGGYYFTAEQKREAG